MFLLCGASYRAVRGYSSARFWASTMLRNPTRNVGFRPVLEVLNPDTLGSDGLKVVTLDLGGGKLGGSSDAIQIIVKNGSTFTAPASDGLTRPDGDTGSYFMWLGSDGKLYAPGASVPADVTKLTAQFALSEQFSLTPGGRYYFDLSGEKIPGTANGNGAVSLPDSAALCSLYLCRNDRSLQAHVCDGDHRGICTAEQIRPQPVCGGLCRNAYGKLE